MYSHTPLCTLHTSFTITLHVKDHVEDHVDFLKGLHTFVQVILRHALVTTSSCLAQDVPPCIGASYKAMTGACIQ